MDILSKAKNIQAMNSYKTQFLHNLIIHLLSVIALTCSVFCFYPYWFPSLYSSIKEFQFLSLPNTCTSIFSPKCLFVVVNIIVVFLVGESKLVGSHSSSPTNKIYDEYVQRSRSLRGISTLLQEKAVQSKLDLNLDEDKRVCTIVQEEEEVKEEVKEVIDGSSLIEEEEKEEFQEAQEEAEVPEEDQDQEAGVKLGNQAQDQEAEVKEIEVALTEEDKDQKEKGSEEETDWPAEELNRRVEEFIARVNRQRWLEEARLLESRLLVCCSA
ncbi:conserved hypothetical protein [Ricinus communis]|uniref:DUF4408 domain-containing protein n=1 Tax=Ricinus communis TaxID=3988 RepID=B9RMA9_RICCO|nr:conserved hypothetical protein [Ricinus communis]|eukprot:XP_002514878.1 uncharacterized protein DDB_G0279979 [Ricinus communis]